jgi:hypothetical protein
VAGVLFNLNADYGTAFSCLDKKDVHLMRHHCPRLSVIGESTFKKFYFSLSAIRNSDKTSETCGGL